MGYQFIRISFAFAFALAAAGCGGANYSVTMYRPIATPQVRPPEQVQLFSGADQPDCAYEEVGLVRSDGAHTPDEGELLSGIRQRVGAAGGDGVVRLQKGMIGTVESGGWEGTIYVCK